MFRMGRFGRNVLSNSGANAIHAAMQLGLICLLFDWLNDADYAAFLMAGYLIGLLEISSDYGGRLWATRKFAVTKTPSLVMRQSFSLKIAYTLAGVAILAFLPFATLSLPALGLCVLIGFTQPGTDPYLWQLRGRERLDIEAGAVLASRVAIAVAMVIAAALNGGLLLLLTIWLAGNVLRMLGVKLRVSPVDGTDDGKAPEPPSGSDGVRRVIMDVFPLGTALVLTCVFLSLIHI